MREPSAVWICRLTEDNSGEQSSGHGRQHKGSWEQLLHQLSCPSLPAAFSQQVNRRTGRLLIISIKSNQLRTPRTEVSRTVGRRSAAEATFCQTGHDIVSFFAEVFSRNRRWNILPALTLVRMKGRPVLPANLAECLKYISESVPTGVLPKKSEDSPAVSAIRRSYLLGQLFSAPDAGEYSIADCRIFLNLTLQQRHPGSPGSIRSAPQTPAP